MGNPANLPKPTPSEISNRLKDLILRNSDLPFPLLMEIESIMRDVDELGVKPRRKPGSKPARPVFSEDEAPF